MTIEELETYLDRMSFRVNYHLSKTRVRSEVAELEYDRVYETIFWTDFDTRCVVSFNIETKKGTIIVDGTKVYDKVFEDLNDFVTIYKHLL